MDKKSLQEMYLAYLKEEGYRGKLDNFGNIFFTRRGWRYYILIDDNDENFFHLLLPKFCEIMDEAEYHKGLVTANMMNCQYKIGKILMVDRGKNVSADVGLFLNDVKDYPKFFDRLLGILRLMANNFIEEMNEDASSGDGLDSIV